MSRPDGVAGRLRSLIDFYSGCLVEESLRDLRFRVSDADELWVGVGLDVSELLETGTTDIDNHQEASAWATSRRVGSAGSRFYLGYPVLVSGSPAEVTPLLYFAVEAERGGEHFRVVTSDSPQINHRLLEDAGFSVDEAVEVAGEIEAMMRSETEASIGERFRDAVARLLETAGIDGSVSKGLTASPGSGTGWARKGFKSHAILFSSERLGYTQSTRQELKSLADDADRWVMTPLGTFLGKPLSGSALPDSELLLVSPLSEAQRRAVSSALRNPVTVVTGPPGTGKSELVLNLVANGIARGETVLVASRNNKAVDVVAERFRGLTDEATLVRAGRTAYRDRAIALMRRVVAGMKPPSPAQVARATADLEAARRDRTRMVGTAAAWSAAEVRCDDLERRWEEDRAGLGDEDRRLVMSIGDGPGALDHQAFETTLAYARARADGRRTILERVLSPIQPERAIRSSRAHLNEAAASAPSLYDREAINAADWGDLVAISSRARVLARAAQTWRELHAAADELAALPEPLDLGTDMFEIAEREAEAGRRFLALSRQNVLASLPDSDEKKLAEYLRAVDQLGGPERLGGRLYVQLRELESRLFTDVQKVFPVWAITTLTARKNLPLRSDLFDLLIVDEASQCDLPSALPLLARAKRCVVIGDDKQLIHVTPLDQNREQALAAEAGVGPEDLVNYSFRSVSLFTLAKHVVEDRGAVIMLDEHYRSHPHIIGFSNDRFYGGRLNVFTEPRRMRLPVAAGEAAVTWEHIAGTTVRPQTGSAYNDAEVERVCEVVERLIAGGPDDLSIGVVTPFRLQKERITRALARRLPAEQIERHQVIADTAHGFQGDERDVVVMSTVISEGAQPGSIAFVDGSPNLFNVSVTRARSQLIVVGDEVTCGARDGLLGDLARYTDHLKEAAVEPESGPPDTDEEEQLLAQLREAGERALGQYEVRGLRVDVALPFRIPPVAIEVDGRSHVTADGTRLLNDVYRDVKLRRAGWTVFRVPAWDVRLKSASSGRQDPRRPADGSRADSDVRGTKRAGRAGRVRGGRDLRRSGLTPAAIKAGGGAGVCGYTQSPPDDPTGSTAGDLRPIAQSDRWGEARGHGT